MAGRSQMGQVCCSTASAAADAVRRRTTDGYKVLRCVFFFQAEDGIRDLTVTGVQTCALPISTHTKNMANSAAMRYERRTRLPAALRYAAYASPTSVSSRYAEPSARVDGDTTLDRKSVV